MYLYRALRKVEIEAGFQLIPKSQEPFVARIGLPLNLPFDLVPRVDYAVKGHQWHGRLETRGISTTPHFHRAIFYAQHSKVIVTIEREVLSKFGVREFVVKDHVPENLIAVPEDDEVIIVYEDRSVFPREIIHNIIQLDSPTFIAPTVSTAMKQA